MLSKQVHDRVRAALPAGVSDDRVKDAATGVLRAAAVSPRLVHLSRSPAFRAVTDLIGNVDGPKISQAVAMAEDLRERELRLVVFCSYTMLFPLLQNRFGRAGLDTVAYHGSMSAAARRSAVERFTSVDGPPVLLASDAGAERLNLGEFCRHSVSLDLPYTPGRVAQRGGRVWRVDTAVTTAVHVDLVCAGTIERGLVGMLSRKSRLMDVLLPETSLPEGLLADAGAVSPAAGFGAQRSA